MVRKRKQGEVDSEALNLKQMNDVSLMRLFILPTVILLIVLNVFPLFWSLILSFSNYSAKLPTLLGANPKMIGTANYARSLTDPAMWNKFITTAKYVVLSVSGEMILGFGLALLLEVKFKGKGIISTLLVLPMTMSPVIVGTMWRLFMDPNWGMLNFLLGIGKVDWAMNPHINLYSVVIVDIWMWTPFVMLLSMAGLSAIPKSLYEAAEVDRASWWFKFTNITLPLVFPLLLIALIFRVMEAFKVFDLPMGLVGRGSSSPQLLSMEVYNQTFLTWKTGYGASIGYVILIMTIAITTLFVRYLAKVKE